MRSNIIKKIKLLHKKCKLVNHFTGKGAILVIGRKNVLSAVLTVTDRTKPSFPGCTSITRPMSQLDGGVLSS